VCLREDLSGRQQQEDDFWSIVRSLEYSADRVSVEAGMLTCKVLASSAAKGSPDAWNRYSHMIIAGRAAAIKANILFVTNASINFVSKSVAKQTGIMVKPVKYSVRLADDETMEMAGERTVYV
jgi:hypothetical protein